MLLFEGATTATFMWVDVVICFVLFVGFFIGWKKGFVDQLFSLVGIVAVLVLAVLMCKPIANVLMATDKGVIFDSIRITIGMSRKEIIDILNDNHLSYENDNTIKTEDLSIMFDNNDISNYISLKSDTNWATDRGLSFDDNISQMEELYGKEYIWEAFNHKGRYDTFIYSLGDIKLEVMYYRLKMEMKAIFHIDIYSSTTKSIYTDPLPDEYVDHWLYTDSTLNMLWLGMSKDSIPYYKGDNQEMTYDDVSKTVKLTDKIKDVTIVILLSEDNLIQSMYTDSQEALTGREIKVCDTLEMVEKYYGINYVSEESDNGTKIVYRFSESIIEFGIKNNIVTDILIKYF